MKHYLILIQYKVPFESLESIVPEHREHLQRAVDAGIVLISGPRVPRTGGVVIARGASMNDIHSLIENDPYKKAGFADYDVIEFAPGRHQGILRDWLVSE